MFASGTGRPSFGAVCKNITVLASLLFTGGTMFSSFSSSSSFPFARAAGFQFSLSTPIQCQNLTATVSGGSPPYQLVIIPAGQSPPKGQPYETRHILSMNLTEGQNSVSFKLEYPAGSQFIALMNDANGVGTGGTGVATVVAASDDDSCLTKTEPVPFFFFTNPNATLIQCNTVAISWDTSASRGNVFFYGLIPGGETFPIDTLGVQPYNWRVSARAGTSVQLIAGDDRGIGSGGSVGPFVVQSGPDSCINSLSPSSTLGSPAGAIQTSSSQSLYTTTNSDGMTITSSSLVGPTGGSGSGSGGGSSHTGAIVGGVVGGVVALALIAGLFIFFGCVRPSRNRRAEAHHDQTVDLSSRGPSAESPDGHTPMLQNGFYQPEPFLIPESGSARPSTSDLMSTRGHNRVDSSASLGGESGTTRGQSAFEYGVVGAGGRTRRVSQHSVGGISNSASEAQNSSNLGTSQAGYSTPGGRDRKGVRGAYPPSSMRATNLVQHEDAQVAAMGSGQEASEELVELPPMYSSVKGPRAGASS